MTLSYRTIAALMIASAPLAAASAQNAQQPAPAPLAKAAYVANIDKGFTAIDTNKDGFADKTEIETAQTKTLAAIKQAAIKELQDQFKSLDKDNNGSLTVAEYTAVAVARQLPVADAGNYLKNFDANKDGKVSAAERRTPATALFDKADTNKDGQLSVAEQQAAMQAAR